LHTVIFDLSTSPFIDREGAKMIKRLYLALKEKGVFFRIAEAHAEVRDMLRSEEIEHLLGHISRKDSVEELVEASLKSR
jgi:sulfate permease, SulP family